MREMPQKYADRMANSADPDEQQSDLDLYCLLSPICQKTSEYNGKFTFLMCASLKSNSWEFLDY